jgi:bacterial/archaeal transporter family protein
MTLNWKLFAFGSALFAGLTAVLAKVGVKDVSSNLATFVRTCVIMVFLVFLVQWQGEWRSPFLVPRRSLIFLVLSGLTTGLSWICYFRALQLGPASLVAPIDKLSLLLAILLSVFFLGEKLNMTQWLGAAFMAFGVVLVALK